ncbi:winged helix-turn-helix domain-containing protein [bacterium]|nr:winged helix-turn-helix domain-containing protein [bacterium]
MTKVTKATSHHLTEAEIMAKIKETVGFWRVQRWLVILNALVDPRPAKQIALHTGLAEQTVHNFVSLYNRFGSQAIETPGKGGRKHSYLSFDEEADFLKSFEEKAVKGQIATANEIKTALEKRLGHGVHKTTVYRILKRHGWRKLSPRPYHVEAKKEEQESFKKNSRKK